jgi:hypothetical protein
MYQLKHRNATICRTLASLAWWIRWTSTSCIVPSSRPEASRSSSCAQGWGSMSCQATVVVICWILMPMMVT